MSTTLPLILEPDALEPLLGRDDLVVIDLCKEQQYQSGHIPGARFLDYGRIVENRKPVFGLMPSGEQIATVLGSLGITPDSHIIAYDDEGGGKACRLLYTLETIGHDRYSLLNGGLHAWANEGHPLDATPAIAQPTDYPVTEPSAAIADIDHIQDHLNDVALLDSRSPQEYSGAKALAARGGHIPGAVNIEWTELMDQSRNLRLKPEAELRAMLEGVGITREREVVVYCHSHHRSAHTYIALKSLGYPQIKGYPGSWSEWGNRMETPVEAG